MLLHCGMSLHGAHFSIFQEAGDGLSSLSALKTVTVVIGRKFRRREWRRRPERGCPLLQKVARVLCMRLQRACAA